MKNGHKKILPLLLALTLTLSLVPKAAAKGSPYYIRVNRSTCTVTIYATDSAGKPAQPVKAMICSVGKPGKGITPTGTYTLTSYRPKWCKMKDGSYGEYISQFKGNYLFHSVCYRKKDPSTLITEEYNELGSPASLGCVRLQTGDAKWIYENCPAGTKVDIFSGSPSDDPLGKPETLVNYIDPADPDSGWDPTSPDEKNPWPQRLSAVSEPEPEWEPEPEPEPEPARSAPTAFPSSQTVNVDGEAVEFQCYALKNAAGNDTHYIRLRDLAALLNGTAAQFQVGWDGGVTVTTQTAYTPDGSELSTPFSGDRAYEENTAALKVDGETAGLAALVLTDDAGGGYTYYRLRDLGQALGFNVGWAADKGIFLETGKPYDPGN